MSNDGVMQEISSLLAQDKSSTEVIAIGFKSSTVYKAQRRMRQDKVLETGNGHLTRSLGFQAAKAEFPGESAQTLNRILEPETEDTVTGATVTDASVTDATITDAVTGEEFEEQFIQEQEPRAVVERAAQRAAESTIMAQPNY